MQFVVIIENLKILKYHTFLKKKKKLNLSIICSNRENGDEEIFKEKELIGMLNIISLIKNT